MFATFELAVTLFLICLGIGMMLKKAAEAASTPIGQELLDRFFKRK